LQKKVKTNYPLSYLKEITETREWDGALHVTDLLNGERETYLKYVYDYGVNPDERAFIINGINAHSNLSDGIGRLTVKVDGIMITGEADYIEETEDGYTLWDYKVSGSYKVAKTIGIKTRDIVLRDQFGNPEVYKSGKKAGQIKTKKETYLAEPTDEDIEDYKLQLNIYRYIYTKKLNYNITKLKIFFIVRDGGTSIALSRGVTRNTYTVDIPLMTTDEIENFIVEKGHKLWARLKKYYYEHRIDVPPMCNAKETWDGRKCESYCPVRDICKNIGG